jgi:hypothetical protein
MMAEGADTAREISSGPHIQVAAICENVLQEPNGVLSLIRIIDRIMISATPGAPASMPTTQFHFKAVISLKSDSARGRSMVGLRPQKPSGIYLNEVASPVLFEGEDRGNNLIIDLNLEFDEEGLYWFDVLIDGRIVTRMPLRIVYAPFAIQAPQ